jgi:AMP phosphorylase
MILKIKSLKFLAGRPVAIIHENIALKLNVGVGERINIKKRRGVHEITCILDIAKGMLRENEIVVSSEIIKNLKLKEKDAVEIEPAIKPLSVNFILKKLNGEKLSYSEIFSIIRDVVNNKLTETEIAYFVSAMYFHEMSKDETINLITAMVRNGKILEMNKKRIFDKHSIGGNCYLNMRCSRINYAKNLKQGDNKCSRNCRCY